jgi:sugar phosphate isomerase/epimerase
VLFGGHVRQLEDIEYLSAHQFDFGEVVFRDASARDYWSRERVSLPRDFFLIGHGPHEGSPNDLDNLWNRYYPSLAKTVELAAQLAVHFLTIHLWVDPRFVKPTIIREKLRFLQKILAHGQEHNVLISLENLSENVQDLSMVVSSVPELSLTLDIGHGELLTEKNASYGIVEELCPWIGHVHLHDNFGGKGVKDDRHLPIGAGTIEVSKILTKILEKGYAGTLTLELDRDDLEDSLGRVRTMIRRIEQDRLNSRTN